MAKKHKIPKDPPKPDIPFALATLEIASQNVKAARKLYEDGYYPEAAFLLQQSIEKGCKSFGFYYGLIRRSDAYRSIGHKGADVYEIPLRQLQKIISDIRNKIKFAQECQENVEIENNFFIEMEKGITDAQRKLQFYSSKSNDYFKISDEELVEIIKKSHNIEASQKIIEDNLNSELFSQDVTDYMRQTAMKILQTVLHTSAFNKDFFEKFDRNTILTILHYSSIGLGAIGPLLQFAVITYPHERRSRYADEGAPSQIYTIEFPLIHHFSECCDITEKALGNLQKMFESFPPPGGSPS